MLDFLLDICHVSLIILLFSMMALALLFIISAIVDTILDIIKSIRNRG